LHDETTPAQQLRLPHPSLPTRSFAHRRVLRFAVLAPDTLFLF
jgi:hypothetical protein